MRSLAIFVHYGQGNMLPVAVHTYLAELSRSFDQVLLVYNSRPQQLDLQDLPVNIQAMRVKNEGYDLGMVHKAFQTIDLDVLDQLAVINDSNVLIGKLEPVMTWGRASSHDFWGLLDSYEKPWFSKHLDTYHIQSFFWVFSRRAIQVLADYLASLDMDRIVAEQDAKAVRRLVIDAWEIGLSQYMKEKGIAMGAFIDTAKVAKEYRIPLKKNLSISHYDVLIRLGYPLLKKRVVKKNYYLKTLFHPERRWDRLTTTYGHPDLPIEELIRELRDGV